MPSNLAIGAFALGAVLLLASLLTGGFKIFGAEVSGTAGAGRRLLAFMTGLGFIVVGFTLESREQGSPPSHDLQADAATNKAPPPTRTPPTEEEMEQQLRAIAEPLLRQLPVSVAPGWTTDQIHVGPGARIALTYTLQNFAGAKAGTTSFGTMLVKAYCSDPELRPMIDLGVTIMLSIRGGIDLVPFESVQIKRIDCIRV